MLQGIIIPNFSPIQPEQLQNGRLLPLYCFIPNEANNEGKFLLEKNFFTEIYTEKRMVSVATSPIPFDKPLFTDSGCQTERDSDLQNADNDDDDVQIIEPQEELGQKKQFFR